MAAPTSTMEKVDQQKIVDGFQKLREQQQYLIGEIARIEMELREHQFGFSFGKASIFTFRTVLKTVEPLDHDRRCFRQLGINVYKMMDFK